MVKDSEEFKNDLLEPLDEKFDENFSNLKHQYQFYSQNEEFKNFDEIVRLNEEILQKHCFKQLQFFKNIILDLLKQRFRQKQ